MTLKWSLLPSSRLVVPVLLLWAISTYSFSVRTTRFRSKGTPTSRSKSSLHYRNDDRGGTSQQPRTARANRMSLPVLGPLLTQRPPLVPGQDFVLNDPTPMQWQTLDQCLLQHAAHVQNATTAAGVTAAPLVAFLDEYTASSTISLDPSTPRGRYATIVAIVGLSKAQTNADKPISTSNGEFMERLRDRQSASLRVRFLAIGRAILTDFYYKSGKEDCMDEQGNLLNVPECLLPDDDDDDDDALSRHDADTTDNIIMARFRILSDDGVRRNRPGGLKTDPPALSSPVHAVARYSQLTVQIQRLHSERQQLVAGIHAAQARLQAATSTTLVSVENDDWEDHDGLGLLFASKEQQRELVDQQPLIDQILRDFPSETTTSDVPSSLARSNYGLGASAAAVSTMAALVQSRLELLQPYYSPAQHTSEEHYYELYSFCAVQALQDSYDTRDEAARAAAAAVSGRHTADRLQAVQDQMTRHVTWLRQQVSILSQELRDCGEECTDLW